MVICYDVLFYMVSKKLQSKSTVLDVAINQINVAMKYIEKYRDEEFVSSLTYAKTNGPELGVEDDFPMSVAST